MQVTNASCVHNFAFLVGTLKKIKRGKIDFSDILFKPI
jgi:hypothetical protein